MHWAYVMIYKGTSSSNQQLIDSLKAGHDCSTDHISSWSGHSRTFRYKGSMGSIATQGLQITLSFTPFTPDPERTLVMGLRAEYMNAVTNECEILHHDR